MNAPTRHTLFTLLAGTLFCLAAAIPAAGQFKAADDDDDDDGGGGGGWYRTRLVVSGGPVKLDIESVGIGEILGSALDSRTLLHWTFVSRPSKITVRTDSPGQRFSLQARATDVWNGTSAGTVELSDGMPDRDLVVGISSWFFGRATVVFEASASIEDGSTTKFDSDVHTVTYTITER